MPLEQAGAEASALPRVCVVDDDPAIRESLRFLFEDAGYEVEEASDGVGALALLRAEQRQRVVLLDRMMPRLDGLSMLHRLSDEPELLECAVILFMTARNDLAEPENARLVQHHTFATVTKPFNLDALLAKVEDASRALIERGAAT